MQKYQRATPKPPPARREGWVLGGGGGDHGSLGAKPCQNQRFTPDKFRSVLSAVKPCQHQRFPPNRIHSFSSAKKGHSKSYQRPYRRLTEEISSPPNLPYNENLPGRWPCNRTEEDLLGGAACHVDLHMTLDSPSLSRTSALTALPIEYRPCLPRSPMWGGGGVLNPSNVS